MDLQTMGSYSVATLLVRVAGLTVMLQGAQVTVFDGDGIPLCQHMIPDWPYVARFPTGLVVRLLRTRDDPILVFITSMGSHQPYGYALNLTTPTLSEWGFFPQNREIGGRKRVGSCPRSREHVE